MENEKETKSDENCTSPKEDVFITCRGDLTSYFEDWDHSINKVHLSKVSKVNK